MIVNKYTKDLVPGDVLTGHTDRGAVASVDVEPAACTTQNPGAEGTAQNPSVIHTPGGERAQVIAEAVIADAVRVSTVGHDTSAELGAFAERRAEARLPQDSAERTRTPLCTGLLDYAPDALRRAADLYHEPVEEDERAAFLVYWLSKRGEGDATFHGIRHALDMLEEELGGEACDETGGVELGDLFDIYPRAMAAIAQVSWHGNEKHNPGQPLHHARDKSQDHPDCILRHLVERGGFDGPFRHTAAQAWRWIIMGQLECEAQGATKARGAKWTAGGGRVFEPKLIDVRYDTALSALAELERADRLQALGKFPKTIAMCNDFEALAVLVEEVGEVSHEVNETIGREPDAEYTKRLRTELIQVAAVAIGWAARIEVKP